MYHRCSPRRSVSCCILLHGDRPNISHQPSFEASPDSHHDTGCFSPHDPHTSNSTDHFWTFNDMLHSDHCSNNSRVSHDRAGSVRRGSVAACVADIWGSAIPSDLTQPCSGSMYAIEALQMMAKCYDDLCDRMSEVVENSIQAQMKAESEADRLALHLAETQVSAACVRCDERVVRNNMTAVVNWSAGLWDCSLDIGSAAARRTTDCHSRRLVGPWRLGHHAIRVWQASQRRCCRHIVKIGCGWLPIC